MSFLYDKRTKQAIAWVWGIIVVVITFSMIIAYSGLTNYFSQQQTVASTAGSNATSAAAAGTTTPAVKTAPVTVSSTAPVSVQQSAPKAPAASWGFGN